MASGAARHERPEGLGGLRAALPRAVPRTAPDLHECPQRKGDRMATPCHHAPHSSGRREQPTGAGVQAGAGQDRAGPRASRAACDVHTAEKRGSGKGCPRPSFSLSEKGEWACPSERHGQTP